MLCRKAVQQFGRLQCSPAAARALSAARTSCPAAAAAGTTTTFAASSPAAARPRKVVLIDGHNLCWRAYYGILKNPYATLQTQDGIPTTVTFGFIRSLLALLEQEQPHAVVVVFDAPGGTAFRREALAEYKANRVKPPPEFAVDFSNLQLLLRFLRLPTIAVPGYEADDVMAGLAAQASAAGWSSIILSTDKDMLQVVNDDGGVAVLKPSSSSSSGGSSSKGSSKAGQLMDEAAVREQLGVPPSLVADWKALVGDPSDNIPGVYGIGSKTATQLLQTYGNLAGVFQHAAEQKPGVARKLSGQQEQAEMFKQLATVRPEAAPQGYDFDAACLQGFAASEVEPLLMRLQMSSLQRDIKRLQHLLGGQAAADPQLTAALPAALEQIAASAQALTTQQSSSSGGDGQPQSTPDVQQTLLPTSQAAASSSSSGNATSSAAVAAPAPAPAAAATSPHPPPSSSAAGPSAGGTDVVLLSDIPSVRLVTTPHDLQALVNELLQQQQVPVVWSWPQTGPYRPGHSSHQQPPLGLCCTWQPLVQQTGSSGLTLAPPPPAAATAAAAPAPSLPPPPPQRSRRRTRASTTRKQQPAQQQVQQEEATSSQQQQQQDVGGGRTQLAVVVPSEQLPMSSVLAAVKPLLLESSSHPKCFFESKRAYTELHHQGIQLQGVVYDVLVAGCLLESERWSASLDPDQQQAAVLPAMTQQVLHTSLQDLAAALQQHSAGASSPTAAAGPSQQLVPAWVWPAAAEAWATLLLQSTFTTAMQQLGDGGQLQQLLDSIEVPVQRVLSAMEVTGVRCDKQVLLEQGAQLQAEVSALEQQLYALAGRPFNLRSPKERSAVIYDELGLNPKAKGVRKTKSGSLSTSMSEIEKLPDSPFKSAFTEWSKLSSLLSRYYNTDSSYISAINPDTGRIHTTFHQVGVATGRLASSNPNMQAVVANERGKMFRAAFTADAGHLLVAADYSQVELRVMAALSGDEALLQAFADGQDVHAATARLALGKTQEEPLTSEERQAGKKINFAVLYGAGARQLAKDLGKSQKEAKQFLDNFKAAHPKLYEYKTHCLRMAVGRGFTLSAMGRRRHYSFQSEELRRLRGVQDLSQLPDMKELQRMASRDDAHVLLQATNAPIQSTSADAMKAALVELHTRLSQPPDSCRLLLTAHDDVLLEVPCEQWPAVKSVVAEVMEGALLPQHRLMLKAAVSAGATWLECK